MTITEFEATRFKDLGSLIGVFVAVIVLIFTAKNTLITARANRARFWLDLRTHFYRYDHVHRQLRPGGEWTGGGGVGTSRGLYGLI